MRVAIVGSREFHEMDLVRQYVAGLDDGTVVVSGGARGVDRVAVESAKYNDLDFEEFEADWETHGKKAGFMRNQQIVDAADRVVAFWDGQSRGTMETVNRAKKAGKPVLVITHE